MQKGIVDRRCAWTPVQTQSLGPAEITWCHLIPISGIPLSRFFYHREFICLICFPYWRVCHGTCLLWKPCLPRKPCFPCFPCFPCLPRLLCLLHLLLSQPALSFSCETAFSRENHFQPLLPHMLDLYPKIVIPNGLVKTISGAETVCRSRSVRKRN